jgi:hypothetical protein
LPSRGGRLSASAWAEIAFMYARARSRARRARPSSRHCSVLGRFAWCLLRHAHWRGRCSNKHVLALRRQTLHLRPRSRLRRPRQAVPHAELR